MKKRNLNEVTFCIPIRIESFHRERNLLLLLRFLNRYIDTNYIILEADEKRCLTRIPRIKNLEYCFIKDEDPIFHRTKYINQMLKKVRTPYAAIWDTDAVCSVQQLMQAYEELAVNSVVMVYPYDGRFYQLSEYQTVLFDNTLCYKAIDNPCLYKAFINNYYSVGGAFLVNVKEYLAAGGENEHFYGWGPEDAERFSRMQILGKKVSRIEGPMYHLYHTRGINSQYATLNIAIRNKKEFCTICGMTPKELQIYVNDWEWI